MTTGNDSIVLASGLVISTLILLWMPATPVFIIDTIINDTYVSIDIARRAAAGQIPHLDFRTPLGSAYYLLHFIASLIVAPPRSIEVANSIIGGFCVLSLLILGRHRMPAAAIAFLMIYIAIWTVAPTYANQPFAITHLASYNRHGWALLSLILVGTLVPATPRGRTDTRAEAAVLAVAVLFLVFSKMTFAIAAVPALITGFFLHRENRRPILVASLCSAAVAMPILALTAIGHGYISDLWLTMKSTESAALPGHSPGWQKLSSDVTHNALNIFIILAILAASLTREKQHKRTIVITFVASIAITLLASNQAHDRVLVTLPIIGVVLLSLGRISDCPHDKRANILSLAVAILSIGVISVPLMMANGSTMLRYRALANDHQGALLPDPGGNPDIGFVAYDRNIYADILRGAMPPEKMIRDGFIFNATEYRYYLQEGLAAYQRYGSPDGSIFDMITENAMNTVANRPPPRHQLQWWHYGRAWNDATRPDPARLFTDIETVMWPKAPPRALKIAETPTARIYGPYIGEHFTKTGETALWEIWVKKAVN